MCEWAAARPPYQWSHRVAPGRKWETGYRWEKVPEGYMCMKLVTTAIETVKGGLKRWKASDMRDDQYSLFLTLHHWDLLTLSTESSDNLHKSFNAGGLVDQATVPLAATGPNTIADVLHVFLPCPFQNSLTLSQTFILCSCRVGTLVPLLLDHGC